MLPAGLRQPDHTKKEPTGGYNPDALKKFLVEQAEAEEDVEDLVPYESGVKRGKAYVAKEVKADDGFGGGDIALDPEIQEALANATDLELTDLAAVLGLHKMLDNEQYYNSLATSEMVSTISFNQATKCKLPVCPPEEMQKIEENPTDPLEMLDLLKRNDPGTDEVNLNNILNISVSTLQSYGEILASNKNLKRLSLAGTRSTDAIAMSLADGLRSNNSLEELNLETNYLSAKGICEILTALNESGNTSLTDLKVANQKKNFGSGGEEKIASILEDNSSICKFSYQFVYPGPRHKAIAATTRNSDVIRQKRMKK
jgi:tropomodulin